MPPRKKRTREVVDLTGDDSPLPKTKSPRTSSSARSTQSSQVSSHQNVSAPAPGASQRLASQQQDPFDNEPDVVELTQADDGPVLQHYGDIDNKIVGVRFYNGLVSPGEVVVLKRDPNNQ